MRRIGKRFGIFLFGLCLLGAIADSARAQSSVSVSASVSQTTIYHGERVKFSVKISGSFKDVSRPQLPEFEGVRLLSSTPSTSRSYSYVNGQSSTSYTYTYYLTAQNKGTYQIPPASITIDGETYQTDPIEIEIIDRNEAAESGSSGQPEIFLKMEVSDLQPVTGQQIIADVILFFKDGLEVNSYQPVPGWKAEGFWKEELKNASRPQASSTVIDGVRYRKARLLQFSLFPTKAGELEISPYEIIVSVQSGRSGGNPFSSFFGSGNRRKVELSSDPLELTVKSVPDEGDSNYLGAVGFFNISRSTNTNSTKVGETVELTTRIEGTGNIPLITKPEYQLPDGLEVYEPQQNSTLNRKDHKISGRKTFTDVVIARSPGSYTIPAHKVSYFNPSQNKYITTTLSEINFEVDANPDAAVASSSPQQFPVQPITGLASWITPTSVTLIGSWWFWAGLLFPLIIFGVGYWQKSYIEKMNTDEAFARSQQATEKAHDRLEEAINRSQNGNIKEAYNMLQKALTGFISDRLNLPQAGLSNADYVDALADNNVDQNLIKNVRMLLDKCASISYAPDSSHEYLKSHVGLAKSMLDKLKKVL